MAADQGLRLAVLGPVRAWRNGREIDLGSPQQRAVLAILLLSDGVQVSPETLVDGVWGDDPPRTAVGTVRTYVYRLRKVLGGDGSPLAIESVAGGYVVRVPPEVLDLGMFRHRASQAREARRAGDLARAATELRDALNLWQGTPLAGVNGSFADARRTGLRSLRLAAIEGRFDLDIQLGCHHQAALELTELVAEHPLRERLRELLMLALYRSGQQAEAIDVYQDARRLFAEELGIDPGPALQDLYRRILVADRELDAVPAGVPESNRPIFAPSQLPPDLPDFIGRADLLACAAHLLTRPDASTVLGIDGLAGVGKTVFAVHLAHAVRNSFPDGQVYVDLTDEGGQPVGPGSVLEFLLQAFGVPPRELPESVGQRSALWWSLLRGRRALVILDDARHSAQVRELLAMSPGCAMVVIGQRRLVDLPVSHWLRLEVLEPDEALALFERVAGTDRVRDDLDMVTRLTGKFSYLPLPVRMAAARLASRPRGSLAVIEHYLYVDKYINGDPDHVVFEDCRIAAAPVERAYRRLDDTQARAFRLLALVDAPDVSIRSAAATLDVEPDIAVTVLESLADLHLIEPDGARRYHYLGLIRPWARRQAFYQDGTAACDAAIARYVGFMLASASNALTMVGAAASGMRVRDGAGLTFHDREAAGTWLSERRRHLLTGIDQGEANPTVARALHRELAMVAQAIRTDPAALRAVA
ncbi:BTAD domain-containing putative transcriptional regulator [Micromonospora sp. NPDC050417]|uniref:AfsR/SARP family transcriptional regulator n=1 Tax=Micromonospora sp. NPDC050417 TaxID=3364280 RepID=UPI0037B47258